MWGEWCLRDDVSSVVYFIEVDLSIRHNLRVNVAYNEGSYNEGS